MTVQKNSPTCHITKDCIALQKGRNDGNTKLNQCGCSYTTLK